MSVHSDKAKQSMEKCIEALKNNFGRVRTGRANPHALDHIKVDYYGQPTPISQLAAIKVPEASMLLVEPWDKTALKSIEKAIETSDLGITPSNDGSAIRLPFPMPTEERRRELAKECSQIAEEALSVMFVVMLMARLSAMRSCLRTIRSARRTVFRS